VPPIVPVSCASFKGTHADGFHKAVRELIRVLCPREEGVAGAPLPDPTSKDLSVPKVPNAPGGSPAPIALFPGLLSPADLRELKRLAAAADNLPVTLLPDYSDTLDGPIWSDYQKIPQGGTSVEDIRALSHARAAIECGRVLAGARETAATLLNANCGVSAHRIGLPVGLRETDRLLDLFASCAGYAPGWRPPEIEKERGRLIDSWVDGHKYVFGKRAIVYGEEDLVVALASALAEFGVVPVLCASGGRSKRLAAAVRAAVPELDDQTQILEGADFNKITGRASDLAPDFLIGSSKGYTLARQLGIPLVRCGFPVHDRIGAQRILLAGYAGAQSLFDRVVNALLERKQDTSPTGYAYL
jgi:nitrogenase molybdenum-iron protein NifN